MAAARLPWHFHAKMAALAILVFAAIRLDEPEFAALFAFVAGTYLGEA